MAKKTLVKIMPDIVVVEDSDVVLVKDHDVVMVRVASSLISSLYQAVGKVVLVEPPFIMIHL